jgi:hypothetical protein
MIDLTKTNLFERALGRDRQVGGRNGLGQEFSAPPSSA